jgi:hypothetical protein
MPLPIHLLERAYQLINANQLQNAELVLDAVVRVDPQNVEAWKTYLLIHQSQNDLDWLKERIIKTKELSEVEKTKLVNYYLHLTKQQNGAEGCIFQTDTFIPFLQEKTEKNTTPDETAIQFELIDVFDYPTKITRKEVFTKPRRRAIYNPFAFDIVNGILKVISRNHFGKNITDYVQKMVTLSKDLLKNPKDTYARFSKSPHFKKYTEVALLVLFILGVRLVISSQFFGYVFLGMFVLGGRWWLLNYGSHSTSTLNDQVRVYLHENKNNLPVIKEVKMDQEQKSDKENPGKNIE